ncbi:MAG: hypothetical protein U0165_11815 [Polyangiaceae bacterium]
MKTLSAHPQAPMSSSFSSPIPSAAQSSAARDYVSRLRARLDQPEIDIHEARDGMLDCFVSTYFEGLRSGLSNIVGVNATPDDVAEVAAGLFRTKLEESGASFESPTIEALSAVKEATDAELHFQDLPVEIRATHDQVCNILLAKAEGNMGHFGDRSALSRAPSSAPATPSAPSKPSKPPSSLQPSLARAPTAPSPLVGPSAHLREGLAALLLSAADAARTGTQPVRLKSLIRQAEQLIALLEEIEALFAHPYLTATPWKETPRSGDTLRDIAEKTPAPCHFSSRVSSLNKT